jgi:hypothetical protein
MPEHVNRERVDPGIKAGSRFSCSLQNAIPSGVRGVVICVYVLFQYEREGMGSRVRKFLFISQRR